MSTPGEALTSELAIDGGPRANPEPLPSIRTSAVGMIGDEELAELRAMVEAGCFSFLYNTKVKDSEAACAALYEMPLAVAVSSGTAGLHTAVTYINPEPGEEIIFSPISAMGSVIPVLAQLAVPVFADVDPATQR